MLRKTTSCLVLSALILMPISACNAQQPPSLGQTDTARSGAPSPDAPSPTEPSASAGEISSAKEFRRAQQEVMNWQAAQYADPADAQKMKQKVMDWARAHTGVTPTEFKRPSTVGNTTIDGDYLAGAWCYADVDVMGESQESAINFLFDRDSGMLFSKTKYGKPTETGKWSVNAGQLLLIPTNLSYGTHILKVEPDEFLLDQMGLKHHFTRGPCEKPAKVDNESLDFPDYVPIYITSQGEGILRYKVTDGSTGPFWLAVGSFTGYDQRPFEPLAGDYGPYRGPDIAISFPMIKVDVDNLAFEIYLSNPYRHIAYLKPEIDPDRAEPLANCGTPSPIGANDLGQCSR